LLGLSGSFLTAFRLSIYAAACLSKLFYHFVSISYSFKNQLSL